MRLSFFRAAVPFLLLLGASHAALAASAAVPGFRVVPLAEGLPGFSSSIVTDSQGTIYLTTTDGWIHRITPDGTRTAVASLPTKAGGNGGLLGMALFNDTTAVVHYTTWSTHDKVLADVISLVDLGTGAEQVLHTFVCAYDFPDAGVSSEHHGGNPAVAPDGSVFVGIGEYGGRTIAQDPRWNGGKIWRIAPDGTATQWALGMRNPYDLAWDPALDAVVLSDNGTTGGDEINVVREGANCGWPLTEGVTKPVEGTLAPVYVFPSTVAPTGLARLGGATPLLRTGYLSTAFVTRSIYYFAAINEPVTASPFVLLEQFPSFLIDVTESPSGEILFTSAGAAGTGVYRLAPPRPGDCNGDGLVNVIDLQPLADELADGGTHATHTAHLGDYRGTWGCDANNDGLVSPADVDTIRGMVHPKRRAVR